MNLFCLLAQKLINRRKQYENSQFDMASVESWLKKIVLLISDLLAAKNHIIFQKLHLILCILNNVSISTQPRNSMIFGK